MKNLIPALICLFLIVPSQAGIIYVDDDAPNDPCAGNPDYGDPCEDGSPEHPFDAVQEAIDVATSDDTVIVLDGTYTGPGNRDIDFLGKAITVRSESSLENCIIDCNGTEGKSHNGFYFHTAEDTNSVLDGFTITNGFGPGGGILCLDSSPTISNCTITDNYSEFDSGGICCERSRAIITNCTISNNSAREGGGISCFQSSVVITNCTISDNSAEDVGGGIFCYDSSPRITNCTLAGNLAECSGGAISCYHGSSPTITGCTITGNTVEKKDGAGIHCDVSDPDIINCTITKNSAKGPSSRGGGVHCEDSSPNIIGCTISGNSAGRHGGGVSGSWGAIAACLITRNVAGVQSIGSPRGGGLSDCEGPISYCTISANIATWGGGLAACRGTIANCIVTGNLAKWGGGFGGCSGAITNCTITGNSASDSGGAISYSTAAINNCIISGNFADVNSQFSHCSDCPNPAYSCIQDWTGEGPGNIDADPCFVEPGYWADANDPNIIVEPNDPNAIWVEGDYHLLRTSPCVDAASDANVYTDIEGNIRPFDFPGVDNNGELPEFDMGAYELVPVEAQMKLTPQALNCRSKGNWVRAHLTLPEGFLPEDVDVNEPAWAEPMGAESESIRVFSNNEGPVKLEICFDRQAFCETITETGEVEVTVIGSLTAGRYFYATDTIKIKPQHQRIIYRYKKNQHNLCPRYQRPPR